MKKSILIVEDELRIRFLLRDYLTKDDFNVFEASNGEEGLFVFSTQKIDLVILDIMMPYKTGIEVCNILRSQALFQHTIIIFLTALSDEMSQIKGLEIGADDYLNKPINPKVLVSRVNAMFRRINKVEESGKILQIANINIDPIKFLVTVNDKEIILAKKEFELLYLLASKPGRVFLRNEILIQVWGTDIIVGDRTIDVHIRKIRQKMNLDCITTVKSVGYKFSL